jgi:hypothetical protein
MLPNHRSIFAKRNLRILASIPAMAAALACDATQTVDATNEAQLFSSFQGESSTATSLTLARASTFNAKIDKVKLARTAGDFEPTDFLSEAPWETLRVRFPKLTDAQFETLNQIYGSFSKAKSKVKKPSEQQAGFVYQLTDFLPPIIQATNEHGFGVEKPNTPGEVRTNCWTTSLSIQRQAENASRPFVSYYDAEEMALVQDNAHSTLLRAGSTSELYATPLSASTASFRRNDLKPGDTILLGEKDGNKLWVAHVATFIDDDVFFEKTGVYNRHLYRLISWADIFPSVPVSQYQFRRFAGKPLPDVKKTIASAPVPLELDKGTGRTVLSQSVLAPANPLGAP